MLTLLLLQGLDVLGRLGLDLFHHLIIATLSRRKLLLKGEPLLEEEFRLLRPHLLAGLDGGGSATLLRVTDAQDPLEQTADLLGIAVLDLQIQQDVPEIDLLGERGQETLEHRAAALNVSVSRAELQLAELGRQLDVGVRRQGLQGTRQQGTSALGGSHGVEQEAGVVDEELGGSEDLLLESGLEEVIRFL